MSRARDIANFGDGIATADIGDGQVTAGKLNSTLDLTGKTVTLPAGVGGKFVSYAVIADVKSSSTDGGTFTSGAWRTRDLNTEITDPDGIVSISSNQFVLGAGDYLIEWSAPAYSVDNHQTRLTNTTDSAMVQLGTSTYSNGVVEGTSVGSARVSIAATKNFEIQHRSRNTKSGNGLGVGNESQWSDNSVFTIVKIYKEA